MRNFNCNLMCDRTLDVTGNCHRPDEGVRNIDNCDKFYIAKEQHRAPNAALWDATRGAEGWWPQIVLPEAKQPHRGRCQREGLPKVRQQDYV